MTKITETTEWRVSIPRERFRALRGELHFRHALVLGRMLNSLRFLEVAYLDSKENEGTGGARQRFAALFFIAAVLFEGLNLLRRIGNSFKENNRWKERVVPILRSGRFDKLFGNSLQPLRNQVVFHFFEDSLAEPLSRMDPESVVFVAGSGRSQGEVNYELSDLLAIDLFMGHHASAEEEIRHFKFLLAESRDLLLEVIAAGEGVLAEYCERNGLVTEIRERGGEWHAA
ncbi:MAG TPA: hypothetical protein VF865_16975 [Acidobacteriaceae bacterium]